MQNIVISVISVISVFSINKERKNQREKLLYTKDNKEKLK